MPIIFKDNGSTSRPLYLLVSGLLTSATLIGVTASTAKAQSITSTDVEEGSSAGGIGEITVTARRRDESAQKVPISVAVVKGDDLLTKQINNGIDLARSVPGLVIRPINVNSKVLRVGIRGVINTSSLLTDDPSVGLYFADVPIAHPYGLGSNFYDLDTIQVLKGPQGTLFGRNTTGGAILIAPKLASIDAGTSGYARASYGNYDARVFEGAVNLPIGGVAALRLAGLVRERNGYTTNILTGQKYDNENKRAFRASVTLEPAAGLRSTTLFDFLRENEAPTSSQLLIVYPGVALGGAGTFDRLLAEQQARGPRKVADWSGTNGPNDLYAPARCVTTPTAICRSDALPKQTLRIWGLTNNTQVDVGAVTLKNIVSYRRTRFRADVSTIPGGSPGVGSLGNQSRQNANVDQFTEELQVTGKAFDQRLDFATGIFYINEWGAELGGDFYFSSPSWGRTSGTFRNKSLGVFGQGTFALLDTLKVTGGVRFNRDIRSADASSVAADGTACSIRVGTTAATLPIDQCRLVGKKSWNAVTWTASLEYSPDSDTLVYLTARRGYKSGGFSLRSVRDYLFSYDPEFVQDIEVGLKKDWTIFGRPLRTNLALFQSRYTDQQVQVNNFSSLPYSTFVSNAGKTRIRGFDADVIVKPTDRLTLTGSLSYSHPKYLEYIDPGSGADLSYRPFALPRWTGTVSAEYALPLPERFGTVTARGDVQWLSHNVVDVSKPLNIAGDPTSGFGQAVQPAYAVANARLEWRARELPVTVGAFVTNLFDKVYTNGGAFIGGIQTSNIAAPRMYGADITYRF